MTSQNDQLISEALPDYDLGRELDRGSYGAVYAARHRQLSRDVAVKQLLGQAADDESEARFRREARILAQLDHAHVVKVYDYREWGDVRLLVMELLTGGTFADRCRIGVDVETAIAATMAAASGIHHVHEHGVLHRDIKPENLMLNGNGVLKVTDFGVARGEAADRTAVELTTAGTFTGTPAYAAPEQLAEALATGWPAVGPAADQYALAAVLYYAISGEFTNDTAGGFLALAHRRMNEGARPLTDLVADAPPHVAAVVMRALSRDPSARYESAESFAIALGEAANADLGAGWIDRSAIKIREAGPIRDVAERRGAVTTVPSAGDTPASKNGRRLAYSLAGMAVVVVIAGLLVLNQSTNRSTSTNQDSAPGAPARSAPADSRPLSLKLEDAWKFTTTGDVFATPLIANGMVVVGSFDKNLYGLDATTGAERWRLPTEGAIRSSATGDGTVAYVGSDDGNVRAVGIADGKERWKKFLQHQIVSSPAAANDSVIVGADALYNLAASDGAQRWRYPTGQPIVSSPVVEGATVIVGSDDGKVHGVDLATGNGRWTYDAGAKVQSSPAAAQGMAIVGSDNGTLHAVDIESGAARWTKSLGSSIKSSPAIDGATVFVGTSAGRVVALDVGSGQERWSATLRDKVDSSPTVVGSRVVIGSNDGRLRAFDKATGELVGRFETGGPILSAPQAAGPLVVVSSYDDSVYGVRGIDGA